MRLDKIFEGVMYTSVAGMLGLAVKFLPPSIPAKYRKLAYIPAGVLGIFGIYKLSQGFAPPPEKPSPGQKFPISIIAPVEGARWSILIPHRVELTATNDYKKAYTVAISGKIIKPDGSIWELPWLEGIILDPERVRAGLGWFLYFYGNPLGTYKLRCKVWDYPQGHVLGDSGIRTFEIVTLR